MMSSIRVPSILNISGGFHSGIGENAGSSHQEMGPFCTICRINFNTQEELVNHSRIHTTPEITPKDTNKGKLFPCESCPKMFRQQSNLVQHRRVHTNERPYPCSYCDKAFKQKSQVCTAFLSRVADVDPLVILCLFIFVRLCASVILDINCSYFL